MEWFSSPLVKSNMSSHLFSLGSRPADSACSRSLGYPMLKGANLSPDELSMIGSF